LRRDPSRILWTKHALVQTPRGSRRPEVKPLITLGENLKSANDLAEELGMSPKSQAFALSLRTYPARKLMLAALLGVGCVIFWSQGLGRLLELP
jgi:hypothetical protein